MNPYEIIVFTVIFILVVATLVRVDKLDQRVERIDTGSADYRGRLSRHDDQFNALRRNVSELSNKIDDHRSGEILMSTPVAAEYGYETTINPVGPSATYRWTIQDSKVGSGVDWLVTRDHHHVESATADSIEHARRHVRLILHQAFLDSIVGEIETFTGEFSFEI